MPILILAERMGIQAAPRPFGREAGRATLDITDVCGITVLLQHRCGECKALLKVGDAPRADPVRIGIERGGGCTAGHPTDQANTQVKPWADGDIVSVVCAIIYLPVGLYLKPGYRTADRCGLLLAAGISLGTLMLVLVDPLRQVADFSRSLLAIALDQRRATLWWSAVFAVIYLVKDLFERPAATP
jgi:hypothetical protein